MQFSSLSIKDFLKEYFDKYKYQSISSCDFIEYFHESFPSVAKTTDFDKWLDGAGRCPVLAPLDVSLVEEAAALAKELIAIFARTRNSSEEDAWNALLEDIPVSAGVFKTWDSKQKLSFLTELKAQLESQTAKDDDIVWNSRAAGLVQSLYDLDGISNSEIRFAWCRLALMAKYPCIVDNVKDFVTVQGRMKFIRPLFNDLQEIYPGDIFAKNLFRERKSSYHSIASKMIERDLFGKEGNGS